MKKFTVILGLALSLSGLTTLQAQMKIYNSNLVKFGSISTSPTLSSGLEVNMPNFLFSGASAKFKVSGYTLEITGNGGTVFGSPSVPTNQGPSNVIIDPITNEAAISISAPKNQVVVGSAAQPLHSLYATKLYSLNGGSVLSFSDRRYKTNIQNLTPALDKIMQLRPVKYDYLEEKDNPNTLDSTRMNRVGLIAQELAEVIPEVVHWLWPDDIYTVDYAMLTPFLIKAMQEQQAQIEAQQVQIEEQQILIEELRAFVTGGNATSSEATFSGVKPKDTPEETLEPTANRLWSNVPNPFKQETRIRYALAEDVKEAQLCIYNLSGQQLSCHRLMDRGESEFTLRAATLMPGIYLYSLIADGHVVDTHRMVVTE